MFKNYLFKSITQVFFPFFVVLFFISSVVLLISIAGITVIVNMTFGDLVSVFLYSLPNTVFFVIPITFVGSCILGLLRLSNDYEMLVLFSLGISPSRLLRFFFPLSLLVSVVLLVFSLALIPICKNAYERFIDIKRTQIDINIKAGELGQKLGEWLVYIDSIAPTPTGNLYNDLVLFSSKTEENFIVAKRGVIQNESGVFRMGLENGSAYFVKNDEMQKLFFQNMDIRSKNTRPNLSPYDLFGYWKGAFEGNKAQAKRFSQAIMTSLFPIVSIFLIPFLGIRNPRIQKNMGQIFILTAMIIYFTSVHVLSDIAPFTGAIGLPLLWVTVSFLLYRKYIRRIY